MDEIVFIGFRRKNNGLFRFCIFSSACLFVVGVFVLLFCSVIIPRAKCFFLSYFLLFVIFFFQISPLLFGPFVVLHFLTVIKRGDTRRRDIHINIHKEERFERDLLEERANG